MVKIKKHRCCSCGEIFPPDYRNVNRQRFCKKDKCRKASKKDSQRRWLEKPENKDYFKGSPNVKRVQEWRKAHPGYWRREKDALQDICSENSVKNQQDNIKLTPKKSPSALALQDIWVEQPLVLLGLIANLIGSALQEDIVETCRRMQQLGIDIVNGATFIKGGQNGNKVPYLPSTYSKSTPTVQLGRSPSGP